MEYHEQYQFGLGKGVYLKLISPSLLRLSVFYRCNIDGVILYSDWFTKIASWVHSFTIEVQDLKVEYEEA